MGSTWTGTPILPSIAALFPSIAASFRSSSSGTVVTPAPFQEKRREVRYSTCDEVEVSLLDFGIEVPGVLRDVSKTGFCVELVSALKAGTRIKVSIRDQAVVFAVVRYCRPTLDTYHIFHPHRRAKGSGLIPTGLTPIIATWPAQSSMTTRCPRFAI
jgi:hypothetical protein